MASHILAALSSHAMKRPRLALVITAVGLCNLSATCIWRNSRVATSSADGKGISERGKPGKSPSTSEHPFNLQGDEYWTKPFKNDRDLAERTIFKNQPGFFIDGPPLVDLAVHDTIPLPIFTCFTQKEAYALPLMTYAVVFAMRLEDRKSFFGFAVPRDHPLPRTPPGTVANETSMMTDNLLPDLKQRIGVGGDSGTYDVVVLLREHVSNRVRIAVKQSERGTGLAGERLVQQKALPAPETVLPPPVAGASLPSYRRGKTSPEIPGAPGIAISAPRKSVLRPGAQVDISGSFRVPLLEHELTGAGPGQDSTTAIIPMTLVAFSTDEDDFGPFVLRMQVPTYDAITPAQPIGTGYFAVNLLDFPGLRAKTATVFVYAFVGEWMAGPIPVGLVAPNP
jgi:hypothetical protein